MNEYKYGSINVRKERKRLIAVREDSRGNLFDKNGNLIEMKKMNCFERIYFGMRKAITYLFV